MAYCRHVLRMGVFLWSISISMGTEALDGKHGQQRYFYTQNGTAFQHQLKEDSFIDFANQSLKGHYKEDINLEIIKLEYEKRVKFDWSQYENGYYNCACLMNPIAPMQWNFIAFSFYRIDNSYLTVAQTRGLTTSDLFALLTQLLKAYPEITYIKTIIRKGRDLHTLLDTLASKPSSSIIRLPDLSDNPTITAHYAELGGSNIFQGFSLTRQEFEVIASLPTE